ncbi:MAG: hypothetical protein JO210_05360, partial [Acidobacteriaceae bacterium]|nr:hypothetical protein [Acidobacteriaceae bacterium]
QLRDHLANYAPAELAPSHAETTTAGGKPNKGAPSAPAASGNKQRKISDQDQAEYGNETDTAQLSSGAPPLPSNPSSNDEKRGGEPDQHQQPPATRAEEGSPIEVSRASNAGNSVPGDLALAMRISSSNGNASNLEIQPGLGTDIPAALSSRAQMVPALETVQQRHQPEAPQPIQTVAIEESSGSPDSAKPDATEGNSKSPAAGFEAELNKALSEPVRAAHVQIAGSDSQRLDIHMLERGGALSVTVRSADISLNKALQEHAPELTGRLSLENFHTEIWAPSTAKNQSGGEFSSGNPQSQGGENPGQRHPGQQQKQNGKEPQILEWLEDFEKNRTAFQKRTDYAWHQ